MLHAALKNLRGHKLRMFFTGFSIILGVSFVAGTFIFTDSIKSTFDNLFGDVYAGTDVIVRPSSADFGESARSFPDSILENVQSVDGVEVAEGEVGGYAQFLDKEGNPIGGQGPPTIGFSWTVESSLNPLKIQDGGRPPTSQAEVIMDRATATTYNFSVGDKVKVITSGPAQEFTLVGIATFGEADSLAGATLAAFEINTAQELFGLNDSFTAINIKANSSVDANQLRDKIAEVIPDSVEVVTGVQQTNEQLDEINQGLGFINTALLAFAGVAIFVGSFIIQNTFRILVAQRSKELALLRAIGATRFQIISMVIYEAVAVAVLSSFVGILLGIGISSAVRSLMNSIGFSLPPGPLTIEPRTVVVSLLIGVIVTIIAALMPALRASRVSPIEAMRENEANMGKRKSLFVRGLLGILIMVVGGVALVIGLSGNVDQPLYVVGFGVVTLFIGVSIFAPLLSAPFALIIGWPLKKLRGMPAELATGNARRTPRRTASSAAALMIGVSLVVFISILASTFKAQVEVLLDDSFPADISILSTAIGPAGPGTAGFNTEVYDTLKSLPELTDVTALRYQIEGARIDGSVKFIAGADADTFDNVFKIGPSENAFMRLATENGILVAQNVIDERNWQVGENIDVTFAQTGTVSLQIVGTFTEPFDTDFIISTETYLANFDNEDITFIAANAAEGFTPAEAKTAAQSALQGYPQLDIQDKQDLQELATTQIDQLLSLIWGLLGFAVIIAVLGITNTLMLSISERTKEIGMLRAIGMTRRQVRSMVRYESIIIALFGSLLGILMGAFFAWAVLQALESEGITGYVLPLSQVVIFFIMATIAGILAAALPARKAAKMNILKAIYHE